MVHPTTTPATTPRARRYFAFIRLEALYERPDSTEAAFGKLPTDLEDIVVLTQSSMALSKFEVDGGEPVEECFSAAAA